MEALRHHATKLLAARGMNGQVLSKPRKTKPKQDARADVKLKGSANDF
jgi:hypothetical protein